MLPPSIKKIKAQGQAQLKFFTNSSNMKAKIIT